MGGFFLNLIKSWNVGFKNVPEQNYFQHSEYIKYTW